MWKPVCGVASGHIRSVCASKERSDEISPPIQEVPPVLVGRGESQICDLCGRGQRSNSSHMDATVRANNVRSLAARVHEETSWMSPADLHSVLFGALGPGCMRTSTDCASFPQVSAPADHSKAEDVECGSKAIVFQI